MRCLIYVDPTQLRCCCCSPWLALRPQCARPKACKCPSQICRVAGQQRKTAQLPGSTAAGQDKGIESGLDVCFYCCSPLLASSSSSSSSSSSAGRRMHQRGYWLSRWATMQPCPRLPSARLHRWRADAGQESQAQQAELSRICSSALCCPVRQLLESRALCHGSRRA